MKTLREALAGLRTAIRLATHPWRHVGQYTANRLAQAMRCPVCEHSTLEASAECACWDPGCLCVVRHEEHR